MGAITGQTPNKDSSPMLTSQKSSDGQSALSALLQQSDQPTTGSPQQRPQSGNTSMLDEYLKSVLAQS